MEDGKNESNGKIDRFVRFVKGSWPYWFFITARLCDHEPGEWKFINLGMGKIRHCKKCGKMLDII